MNAIQSPSKINDRHTMTYKTLRVWEEFSSTPGPRYPNEGKFCGQDFREKVLLPALQAAINNNYTLVVDLDQTAGYGTSFLEESFGGLIRNNQLKIDDINKHLRIKSDDEPELKDEIDKYLKDAAKHR
jgi:hypothetical protein